MIEKNVERLLKGGPIYTCEGFVTAIKGARKTGAPFKVHEQTFDNFYNIKNLVSEMGVNMGSMKLSDAKVLKVTKANRGVISYKTSFNEEFKDITTIKKKKNN